MKQARAVINCVFPIVPAPVKRLKSDVTGPTEKVGLMIELDILDELLVVDDDTRTLVEAANAAVVVGGKLTARHCDFDVPVVVAVAIQGAG